MTGAALPPAFEDLVRELRIVREKGLVRLRTLDLPALHQAARTAGRDVGEPDPQAVEALLREAVDALGGDTLGEAAAYLFGLVRGTVGWRPRDRRERAASIVGLSVESFRKQPESLLLSRLAEEILRICSAPAGSVLPAAAEEGKLAAQVLDSLQEVLTRAGPDLPLDRPGEIAAYGPFAVAFGPGTVPVTVHAGPVEGLTGIDILVSSENTLLEPAKPFKSSLSARIRSAAAHRDPSGMIVEDVIANGLVAWTHLHGRTGLPVEPGRVAWTEPGELARHGIRRIYHAAIASPVPNSNDYQVDLEGIFRAVGNAFALARQHRAETSLALRSICFPLFGAGRGGLDPAQSLAWSWPAIRHELTADPSWKLHLSTWRPSETAAVLRELLRHVGPADRNVTIPYR
jgi:O-acetyl-ADP-ribose deacetylase (regulator of RNase III)